MLFIIGAVLVLALLLGAAITAMARAAREGQKTAQALAPRMEGNGMEKVSYAALLLLMLGVTSGFLGGL
ncbi:hypothetical protein [Roseovarius aquimarinus]|uniref:HIG1 domain-containing protein n=1 Tax=Roseovarius aquimarinus TaxID=1229156 RepID=A0ABW7I4U3_9RHOB